jgi:16S rRNA (guanine966-N2)-methyltransferase
MARIDLQTSDSDEFQESDDAPELVRGQSRRPVREKPVRPVIQKFAPTKLRIVAGQMGGRKIVYSGDPAIRPMKEKTRESVFSLLGGYLYGTFVVDLFGGTGILAMESVSRGAERGVIFELSRPAVVTIVENLKLLRLESQIEVHNVDTLRWLRSIEANTRNWPKMPWVIYCCPPYRLWDDETQRLLAGISELFAIAPPGSRLVCETEQDFDMAKELPDIEWDIRKYNPAYVAVASKPEAIEETVQPAPAATDPSPQVT